jgi:ribosomal protein L11 methyltransferase
MNWIEVSVLADREAAEVVSAVFAEQAYGGGVAIDEDITPSADGDGFTYNLDKPVRIKAYIAVDDQAGEKVALLRSTLDHLSFLRPIEPISVRSVADEDWANAWKEHYHVLRLGKRLVIAPTWRTYDAKPDDVVIRLDPGMAFGTGLHPTTRMCLEKLEEVVRPAVTVLDVGTGSGILALAAARLGAGHVLAVETDPVAVDAAEQNVALNNLSDAISVRQGSVPLPQPQQFDIVVANIIARVIAELAPALAAALRPTGVLIASGIIAERSQMVEDALAAAGLSLVQRVTEGDWVTLLLTPLPPSAVARPFPEGRAARAHREGNDASLLRPG